MFLLRSEPLEAIGFSWKRLLMSAVVGGILCVFTDWLFMGDWLYKHFDRHPEIWRVSGRTETGAIMWASALPFLTCLVFALLASSLQLRTLQASLMAALGIWVMVPVPMFIANGLFMKISPGILVSYILGWLVKLAIAAAVFALMESRAVVS